MEESQGQNLKLLAEAASDFASFPGVQSDASVEEFLNRFPLPLILSSLQSDADVPGFESALVSCLERIFKTRYGASFIPQYMPFVQAGLQENSQLIRCLACKTVSYLFENFDGDTGTAMHLVVEYEIYPLLVNCLIEGNELVTAASTDAIVSLAKSSGGIGIIFPSSGHDTLHLKNIALRCSSLARMRVLALIVKLFLVSTLAASAVYDSNLLGLLEAEVNNTNDILMTLSALELLYELAESPHGRKFLLRTTLLQKLTSIISDKSLEAILRTRAVWISGRLLSSDDLFIATDESSVRKTLLAIDGRLELLKNEDTDERECALEALGLIGTSNQGAIMLLSSPTPVARHAVEAAFDRHGRGKQLAALHALANISGEHRPEDSIMLSDNAEESLRRLIYTTASESSKLTTSGLFLSVLQQDSETRLAAYRMIAGLAARTWCMFEICSKQEIIDIVTDARRETDKKDQSPFIDEHDLLRKMCPFLRCSYIVYSQRRFRHSLFGSNEKNCQFAKITCSVHAPCQNLSIKRGLMLLNQDHDGCIGSSSTTEHSLMSGSAKLTTCDDSSIHKNADIIQNFLKAGEDHDKLKSALDQCIFPITENLVIEVLHRHRSDWHSSFFFFNWASSREGYTHGTVAINEMLDILGRMKQFKLMRRLVDEIPQEKRKSLVNERTFAILLNRYASGHKVEDALDMFYKRKEFGLELDTAAFHTLLMSLCRYKHVEAAESLFLLKQDEFPPDIKSRNIILNGWCVLGSLREAKRFWNDIIVSGCKPDLFTYGIFINALSKAGKLNQAVKLFRSMCKKGCLPDVAICNCIIDALCFKKRIPDALAIFGEMNEHHCLPNVATYNSLIKHICKICRMDKAYELLDEMERKGCTPNTRTFGYFFKSLKKPEEVPELLERMEKNGVRLMGDTYNLLLKLYTKWNHLGGVQSTWVGMEKNGMGPDQRSYTIMIHALYDKGRLDEALQYFMEMTSKGMISEPKTKMLVEAIKLKHGGNGSILASAVKNKKKVR